MATNKNVEFVKDFYACGGLLNKHFEKRKNLSKYLQWDSN